jgi:hypothetical protein
MPDSEVLQLCAVDLIPCPDATRTAVDRESPVVCTTLLELAGRRKPPQAETGADVPAVRAAGAEH